MSPLFYSAMTTPVGRIYLGAVAETLCALTLGSEAKPQLFHYFSKHFPDRDVEASKTHLSEPIQQLEAYFDGHLKHFELDLHLEGTAFQKKVWTALSEIPYGRTISYGELAQTLDLPGGSRAVGSANGQNPIPIIIPCHRVIAADGSLGGYTGGLDIKRRLLDLEEAYFAPRLFLGKLDDAWVSD